MSLRTLPRLIRTVRHLKSSQLFWRCRYTLLHKLHPPRLAAPEEIRCRDDPPPSVPVFHRSGPRGPALLDDLARGRMTHLNRSVDVGRERPDWQLGRRASGRLWTITLHYHGWVYGLAEIAVSDSDRAPEAARLLEHYLLDWIERCDLQVPGARDLAWNSFAIATRLGWWIRAYERFGPVRDRLSPRLERSLLQSLWRQASYLHDHLEWDLRGNHLLRDLVGLAWAGRFLAGETPRRWLRRATELAPAQLTEQVLRDGAHFERSPMYHIHVMEDVLALALLVEDRETAHRALETWERMADYLTWVRYPDGTIPLLNDGGWNSVTEPNRMLALGRTIDRPVGQGLPRGGRHFDAAGLVVWHGDPWVVFFDVGPIGPDFVPGHGHADTLTLECGHRGLRLFVDPGSYGYDRDERRRRERSTAAHNTVSIDAADSSEVWHIFRVGRRARPADVGVEISDTTLRASAAHTGYRHLAGAPIHRRRISVESGGGLKIEDRVEGSGTHVVRGGFTLDPAWSVTSRERGWRVRSGGETLDVVVSGPATLDRSVERVPYHPEYGVEIETRRLCWTFDGLLPVEVRTLVDAVQP